MGSSGATAAVLLQYKRSRAFQLAWKNRPASACSKTSSASMCAGAGGESAEQSAQLFLAASPAAYSSTSPIDTGGRRIVSAAVDQKSCETCVAFVVASAAESAVTSALALGSVTQVSLSVQALYYCGQEAFRECDAGWSLQGGLEDLRKRALQIPTANCLEYAPDPSSSKSQKEMCAGRCSIVSPELSQGRFEYRPITAAWKAHRHIRQHGGVISKFQVFDDFRPFFEDFKNALKVYSPSPKAKFVVNHAVFIVGYDLERQFFYIKNSWGPNWGEDGFFRVTFGCCGILEEAFGIVFEPFQLPVAAQLPVKDGPGGCYTYRAVDGDYLSGIALRAGIPLEQFMLDNTARVPELDASIVGKELLLCNPQASSVRRIAPAQQPAAQLPSTASAKPAVVQPTPQKPLSVPESGRDDCIVFTNKCPTSAWFAIAYKEGGSYTTAGWWELTAGDVEFCWPEAMKGQQEVMLYFKDGGFYPELSQFQPFPAINDSSGKDSLSLCVEEENAFRLKQADKVACTGAQRTKVGFYRTSKDALVMNNCPVCFDVINRCKKDVFLATATFEGGSSYTTWGWDKLPGGQTYTHCYSVAAAGDPQHVSIYLDGLSAWARKPGEVANWPGKDYADGKFCVADPDGFSYEDVLKMKCDGKNQFKRQFWRIALPATYEIDPEHCDE